MSDLSTGYFSAGKEGGEPDPSFPPVFTGAEEVPFVNLGEGIRFKPIFGRNILFNYVYFEPHTEAPMHQHPEAQSQIFAISDTPRCWGCPPVLCVDGVKPRVVALLYAHPAKAATGRAKKTMAAMA